LTRRDNDVVLYSTAKRSKLNDIYDIWGFHSIGGEELYLLSVWRLVVGRLVPDVSKDRSVFIFKIKQFKENAAWPWR